jgi:hypothetical protein
VRSAKQKQKELLRRRRAGEVIGEEELSSPEEDVEQKGIYDTDSDNPALTEFDDDDEGVLEEDPILPIKRAGSVTEGKAKLQHGAPELKNGSQSGDDNSHDSLDDFVVEEDDGPIGVPDHLLEIPLEWTSHAHKPLKEHFHNAVEWLVQLKINPAFTERNHAVYRMAWRRLDDEVSGLALSKFFSSAWKKDFTMALRARPYIKTVQLAGVDIHEFQTCQACGRSRHPAKWAVSFSGSAYVNDWTKEDFLNDVESDSDDSEESDGQAHSGRHNYDEVGNEIVGEDSEWYVGAVCNSNAETAHSLIHWKRALFDWVREKLEDEGYMKPEKLQERESMKPKRRYKLVDQIVEGWVDQGIMKALYDDFRRTLEMARNKTTDGKISKGWR